MDAQLRWFRAPALGAVNGWRQKLEDRLRRALSKIAQALRVCSDRMAGAFQGAARQVELRGFDEQVIRIEGCGGENADLRGGERHQDGGQDAGFGERERALEFQHAPAGIALDRRRYLRGRTNDRQLVGGARYRTEKR